MSNKGDEMKNGPTNYFESRTKVFMLCFAAFIFLCSPSLLAQNRTDHRQATSSTSNAVMINGTTPILLASDEAPVKKAADDLASDMEKVFGKRPQILKKAKPGTTAILIGEESKLPEEMRSPGVKAPESFSISVRKQAGEHAANVIVLSGADM